MINFIRIHTAALRCDVVDLTIRRWATEEKYAHLKFPKLVDMGDNSVGLVEEEFDSWQVECVAKRDDEAARVAEEAHERDDVDADGDDADGDDDDDEEEEEAA